MLYADVKRLFGEDNGTLAGVISQSDIIRAVASGRTMPSRWSTELC